MGTAHAADGDINLAVDVFADGLLAYCELVTPLARLFEIELFEHILGSLEWVARECPDLPMSIDYAQVACETLVPVLRALTMRSDVDSRAYRDRFDRVRKLLL